MKTLTQHINEWNINNKSISNIDIKFIPKDNIELIGEIVRRYSIDDKHLDMRDVDVSNITVFNDTFYIPDDIKRRNKNVETIDIRGWKTSKMIISSGMFYGCEKLHDIYGIEDIDVSSLEDAEYMFDECKSLEKLDLSKWNPKHLQLCDWMFYKCHNLKEIKGMENWQDISEYDISLYGALDFTHKDLPIPKYVAHVNR